MEYDQLKLENQLCFPVYAASRLITKEYQPYLEKIGITYPQYLVLLVLWEQDKMPVNDIAKKLILKTNTLTPLVKRMQEMGLVERVKSTSDERKVLVCLTKKGIDLKEEAAIIPESLAADIVNDEISVERLIALKQNLTAVIAALQEKQK